MQLRSELEIHEKLNEIVPVASLIDRLSKAGFSLFLYGGSVRDLLTSNESINDYDFLCVHKSMTLTDANETIISSIRDFSNSLNCRYIEYPGELIHIYELPGGFSIDVHYPASSIMPALTRADLSINGIAFDIDKSQIFDPLNGLEDLRNGKLRLHSPQYVITNPPNFPRLFRIAAKMNFKLEDDFLGLLRNYAHYISLSDGRSNLRTILELLKFFSLPNAQPYIKAFAELKFLDFLFPEITILHYYKKSVVSQFDLNLMTLSRIDEKKLTVEQLNFLHSSLGNHTTVAGYILLISLFWNMGKAYASLWPDAPYQKFIAEGDNGAFAARMHKNLLSHMAARYKNEPRLKNLMADIYPITVIAEAAVDGKQVIAETEDKERAILISKISTLLAIGNK